MQTAPPRQIIIKDLFNISTRLDSIAWEYFREGVKIHRLYGNQREGPSAALLWYQPGSGVPRHEHLGYEHIIVLSNAQSDHTGEYPAGAIVINPPGSTHEINVKNGGVVLAIWERPVNFLDSD